VASDGQSGFARRLLLLVRVPGKDCREVIKLAKALNFFFVFFLGGFSCQNHIGWLTVCNRWYGEVMIFGPLPDLE